MCRCIATTTTIRARHRPDSHAGAGDSDPPRPAPIAPPTMGSIAPQAAGKIHSDFEKGFIRAEIISYNDYVNCGAEQASKEAGKMRVEGKTYIMNDSDIINVLFNI